MHTGRLLPPGGALAKKPRVYQLAAEFGIESKIIMAKLLEMGEFVRSASSTVEHFAAYKLRIQFAAQAPRKPPSSGLAGTLGRCRADSGAIATVAGTPRYASRQL